jgi:hypothetical protein
MRFIFDSSLLFLRTRAPGFACRSLSSSNHDFRRDESAVMALLRQALSRSRPRGRLFGKSWREAVTATRITQRKILLDRDRLWAHLQRKISPR